MGEISPHCFACGLYREVHDERHRNFENPPPALSSMQNLDFHPLSRFAFGAFSFILLPDLFPNKDFRNRLSINHTDRISFVYSRLLISEVNPPRLA